jgi:hypothetical protein
MPNLVRRRYPERQHCWQIYYGDVCIGTIARRTGCPVDVDQWKWGCDFYPGTEPGCCGHLCRSRTLHMGDDDPRLRWRWFYGLSSEVKNGIDGRLIHADQV